jgi:predicted proteasome-type protease
MTRTSARSSDGALASAAAAAANVQGVLKSTPIRYIPGFLYILVLYVAGKFIFADPRAILLQVGEYQLTWVEILFVGAAVVAMAEQLRVSHPGIDNTIEALLMVGIAAVQVLLFALGAAGVRLLAMFNNTEFLLLTTISVTQGVVAVLINARTLRRTIGVGDHT